MDKNIVEAVDLERILQQQKAVRDVLIKPPEARDPWDIDLLHDYVMRNGNTYRLFQGAQEIICKTICRELTLLELPKNALVCKQGEFGDTFYIMFSGCVSIYVETRRRLSLDDDGAWHSGSFQTVELDDLVRMDYLCQKFGTWKNKIERGGTFGEIAVTDPTAKRTGTVICDTPAALICLKRGAYQRLLRITNSSELKFTEVEFLKTTFIFRSWPHADLTQLSSRLKRTTFPAGTFLTHLGAEASVLYFIYDGLVQESVSVVHYCDENASATYAGHASSS
uniref:Uncharacterized protein AlNc14C1168G12822 n=1 Tax=Albugo laibachii Nc14 TaxID=890382 RepID=F0X2K2_9STRA|nr:conserved hypothetical protein [Albugo laibachii Nc14]|eukprot:CCA28109.1 conserved hypothetical protein [Albugo laibachii Nc14]